ncbi:NifU family protein [Vulgatibacter incomptus]|nr:NifU family protein [Vulgatibacter incomptus]
MMDEVRTGELAGADRDARRIAELLELLPSMAGPSTWNGIEELVDLLVHVQGQGLAACLALARQAGVDPSRFDTLLAEDELVSNLLLLHGLHPVPARVRVEQALERIRPSLASHSGGVELVGLDEEGVAHLRLSGACDGCASSRATVEQTVRRAIEEAAPEVAGIEVEEEPKSDPSFVQLTVRGGA